MSTYPNLKIDQELLKIKTNDDEIKDLENKTEKHGLENISESLKMILNFIGRNTRV